jgi:NTE family protein
VGVSSRDALVLSGGGARAAYQVGCLRQISREIPGYRPKIITGVSAGAINAAYLASHRGAWSDAIDSLIELWLKLETGKVYHTDIGRLAHRVFLLIARIITGGRIGQLNLRGMVDNRPLELFLSGVLEHQDFRLQGIKENIEEKLLDSVAVIGTDYGSGRSLAWVEGAGENIWNRSQVAAEAVELSIKHVMASSALPFFFPAVELDGRWYGDGGIRLNAPLSPAMHLGANRILAVSPRAPRKVPGADEKTVYPPAGQIAGVLLNSIFLDLLDYDALQMNRINRLLDEIPEDSRGKYRQVEVMVLRPRQDLGKLAAEHEITLPRLFRYFESGLAGKGSKGADALSMVIFEREYIELLIRLGEVDTAEKMGEIKSFLDNAD